MLIIERLAAGDGPRLRAIRLRALGEAPEAFETTLAQAMQQPAEIWERQLQELATFVATLDRRDLGMVRGAPHEHLPETGELLSMWVAPEARRRRVGAALVDAAVQWARTCGLARLLLDVGEANAPAIALYRSRGFVPNGRQGTLPPPRDHIREIQMVRVL